LWTTARQGNEGKVSGEKKGYLPTISGNGESQKVKVTSLALTRERGKDFGNDSEKNP